MSKQTPKKHILLRIGIGIGSFAMWLLSFKAVRNWLWRRVEKKGKEKIVDVRAKLVEKEEKKELLK